MQTATSWIWTQVADSIITLYSTILSASDFIWKYYWWINENESCIDDVTEKYSEHKHQIKSKQRIDNSITCITKLTENQKPFLHCIMHCFILIYIFRIMSKL